MKQSMARMTILGAAAAIFSCLFVLSFGYAQHAPRPHGVRIDVVAPPGNVEQVRHSLDDAAPGYFDVRPVPTETLARQHLQHMSTSGALVERPGAQPWILTAGAEGVPLQQAVSKALGNVARGQGDEPMMVDVVPLPDGDRAGLSVFALELGLLVPAVIGAIAFFLMGARTRIWVRVIGAVVYAALASALVWVSLDVILGALTGAPWALLGDAAMISGAFVLSVVALHSLFGLKGTAVAAIALFVVGNAVNGVAVPTSMLPDGYRQIAPWMPNNAAVNLVRSDMYFDGHGQGGPLLTLALWFGVAVVIVAAADLVHLRLRHATPASVPEVYATSLVDYLRSPRPHAHRRTPATSDPSTMSEPPLDADSVRIAIGETDRTPAVVVTLAIPVGEGQ